MPARRPSAAALSGVAHSAAVPKPGAIVPRTIPPLPSCEVRDGQPHGISGGEHRFRRLVQLSLPFLLEWVPPGRKSDHQDSFQFAFPPDPLCPSSSLLSHPPHLPHPPPPPPPPSPHPI